MYIIAPIGALIMLAELNALKLFDVSINKNHIISAVLTSLIYRVPYEQPDQVINYGIDLDNF